MKDILQFSFPKSVSKKRNKAKFRTDDLCVGSSWIGYRLLSRDDYVYIFKDCLYLVGRTSWGYVKFLCHYKWMLIKLKNEHQLDLSFRFVWSHFLKPCSTHFPRPVEQVSFITWREKTHLTYIMQRSDGLKTLEPSMDLTNQRVQKHSSVELNELLLLEDKIALLILDATG